MKNSITDLKDQAQNLREDILKTRLDLSLNKLKDTNMVKKKRRDLARVLTEIKQLEIIGGSDA